MVSSLREERRAKFFYANISFSREVTRFSQLKELRIMINSTNAREPVREILVGGVAGGVLGGIVTLALAIGFAGSFVFAAVMAMQGALTGAMGMGWAVAMVLAHTEDEPVMEARDIAAAPIQPTNSQRTGLRRVA
jgi:hypothetical protein